MTYQFTYYVLFVLIRQIRLQFHVEISCVFRLTFFFFNFLQFSN